MRKREFGVNWVLKSKYKEKQSKIAKYHLFLETQWQLRKIILSRLTRSVINFISSCKRASLMRKTVNVAIH